MKGIDPRTLDSRIPAAARAWFAEPALGVLIAALRADRIEMRFVGGCVRDALLGRPLGDIDVATPAPPERVMAALAKGGIKVVPTGLAHGTVTAVVAPRSFEITTLRRDVDTDGRHARVAFGVDWGEDAARRDFTINAIYLSPEGGLYDPVGGLADLAARRVRFVGDPARRIAEDVLRLLRYYRFEALFGGGAGEAAARAACRAATGLLPTLSAERVAHELMRLLAAPDAVRVLWMMREDGVLAAALPQAARIDRLARLIQVDASLPERQRGLDPILRLAAVVSVDREGALALAARLRLSKAERDRLVRLAAPWPRDPAADAGAPRRALYRLGAAAFRDIAKLVAADARMSGERLAALLDLAASWRAPKFPLTGRDVTALGIAPGPSVGNLLAAVRAWWEAGDFAADREACLRRLKEIAGALPA